VIGADGAHAPYETWSARTSREDHLVVGCAADVKLAYGPKSGESPSAALETVIGFLAPYDRTDETARVPDHGVGPPPPGARHRARRPPPKFIDVLPGDGT